ncbi:MAG: hypothetical protein LBM13_01775 [Candidatus Ancillula sp.]|nr:hypothetical protein [Candidatus Ancillula sp.]
MKKFNSVYKQRCRSYFCSECGTVTVETAICTPIIIFIIGVLCCIFSLFKTEFQVLDLTKECVREIVLIEDADSQKEQEEFKSKFLKKIKQEHNVNLSNVEIFFEVENRKYIKVKMIKQLQGLISKFKDRIEVSASGYIEK